MNQEISRNYEDLVSQEPRIVSADTAIVNVESLIREVEDIKNVLIGRRETFSDHTDWVGSDSIMLLDNLTTELVDLAEEIDSGEEVDVETYEGLALETERLISVIEANFNRELYSAMEDMAQEATETLSFKNYNFDHLDEYSRSNEEAKSLLQETEWLLRDINGLVGTFWDVESKYAHFNTFVEKMLEFDENIADLDSVMGLSVFEEEPEEVRDQAEQRSAIPSSQEYDGFITSVQALDPDSESFRSDILNNIVSFAEGRSWEDEARTTLNDYIDGASDSYLDLSVREDGSITLYTSISGSDYKPRIFRIRRGEEPTWSPDI